MRILLSNSSPDPIYEQISRQIREQIMSGALPEMTPLPSIRRLARDLHISVITTKRAYEELEREGYIDTVAGKGSFVAAQNKEWLKERQRKFVEDALNEAISLARLAGLGSEELREMLVLLEDQNQED